MPRALAGFVSLLSRGSRGSPPITPLSSSGELGPIPELRQRFRIRERLDVPHRLPVNDVADRELDDLSALGPRNVGDLSDLGRHVPRRGVAADLTLDLVDQGIVESQTFPQPHEEDHAHVCWSLWRPILTDDYGLEHLLE